MLSFILSTFCIYLDEPVSLLSLSLCTSLMVQVSEKEGTMVAFVLIVSQVFELLPIATEFLVSNDVYFEAAVLLSSFIHVREKEKQS